MFFRSAGIWGVLLLTISALVSVSGCTSGSGGVVIGPSGPPAERGGGPPPWAPAHGYRAKHNYRYYPSLEIYYDTRRNLWFYYQRGGWRVEAELPAGIRVSGRDYVRLEMDADRPYRYHSQVVDRYPPGKAKRRDVGPPGKGRGHGPPPGKGKDR
jgi:hypothetical protein